MNIFNNYSLIKSIKSYNIYNVFNQLTNFNYICTSFNGYIVIDYGYSRIIKFNQNFSFVSSYYSSNPRSIITVYNLNTTEIYVSLYNRVYKFNITPLYFRLDIIIAAISSTVAFIIIKQETIYLLVRMRITLNS